MEEKFQSPQQVPQERLRVEILQANSSGLVVSLKTKIFGLRVPQEEIFQFYLRTALIFKWAYYQVRIYFCDINYVFQLPKNKISIYNFRYFKNSPSELNILK